MHIPNKQDYPLSVVNPGAWPLACHLAEKAGVHAKHFFWYLLHAFYSGHLYVNYANGVLFPTVNMLIEEVETFPKEIYDIIISEYHQVIAAGSKSLLYRIEETKIVLERVFLAEEKIAQFIAQKIEQHENSSKISQEVYSDISIAYSNILEKQKQAIIEMLQKNFFLLLGGPGTGKTFTIATFISYFIKNHTHKNTPRILVCAPTGKALFVLYERIKQACNQEIVLDAKTMHTALYEAQKNGEDTTISYDVIIVDESSMIDLFLFETFLRYVNTSTKLILVGDPEQLPPVDPGSPFEDLSQTTCPKVVLDVCMRTERKELDAFAHAILKKDVDAIHEHLARSMDNTEYPIQFISLEGKNIEHALQKAVISSLEDVQNNEDGFSKRRFLSPVKNGPFGVHAINKVCDEYLNVLEKKQETQYARPIIVTKNDWIIGCTNGETGLLLPREKSMPCGLFLRTTKGFPEYIPINVLPSYELAFCISVHKSQGSEADEIFLLLPKDAILFGKKMLYTAVTRARKKLTICTTDDILFETIRTDTVRTSTLSERLERSLKKLQEERLVDV